MHTHDLGHGWELSQYPDGSARVRSTRTGMRIDLPADSVQRLRTIVRDAEKLRDPVDHGEMSLPHYSAHPEAGQVYRPDGRPMREG
jgi:hypothetical protein